MEDTSRQYAQQDFNLPHDVVELPSRGKFYKNKKYYYLYSKVSIFIKLICYVKSKKNKI